MKVTIHNLAEATAQQVFDTIATHLLTQGKQSKNEFNECHYRCENGNSCAAGCLIPEEDYNKIMENRIWWSDDLSNDEETFFVNRFNISKNHSGLIRELQVIHDSFSPENWLKKLEELAEEARFNTKSLNKA